MRTITRVWLAFLVAVFSLAAMAHPNHGESAPVSKEDVTSRGDRAVKYLVDTKQLAQSWRSSRLELVSSRQTRAGLVWVLQFRNPAETSQDAQTLYLFFDEFGNFMEVNFSGNI